jgi:hypothetical protein
LYTWNIRITNELISNTAKWRYIIYIPLWVKFRVYWLHLSNTSYPHEFRGFDFKLLFFFFDFFHAAVCYMLYCIVLFLLYLCNSTWQYFMIIRIYLCFLKNTLGIEYSIIVACYRYRIYPSNIFTLYIWYIFQL